MSVWRELTRAELEARHALTAKLDPAFAAKDKAFWESRSINELGALRAGAWDANDPDTYEFASTYIALKNGEK